MVLCNTFFKLWFCRLLLLLPKVFHFIYFWPCTCQVLHWLCLFSKTWWSLKQYYCYSLFTTIYLISTLVQIPVKRNLTFLLFTQLRDITLINVGETEEEDKQSVVTFGLWHECGWRALKTSSIAGYSLNRLMQGKAVF